MSKVPFTFGQPYRIDLSNGGMRYGSVSEQRLAEVYTDGRVAGLVNEHLVESIFQGMTVVADKGAPFDLLWQDGDMVRKLEARGLNANGISFLPSDQKGKGRSKDIPAYLLRRSQLDGYVVVDLRRSPVFTVLGITNRLAPDKGDWTMRQWDRERAQWLLPHPITIPRSWP